MSSRGFHFWVPCIALPVCCTSRSFIAHAFPPHVASRRKRSVREDRVACHGFHGIGVRVVTGSWCNTKEACFWVDCIQAAIGAVLHPANVIADCLGLPAWNRWNKHCKVCFSARRWKCCRDVLERTFRIRKFQNQHVLCKPTCITRHH